MGAAGYIHPPAMSVRGGALRAPKKKVEGGADLHCPNLTLWFRAALAVQTQADCGAKWAFTSWGRCQPTHRVVKIPAGILLLSKSLHLKCLVLSGSELLPARSRMLVLCARQALAEIDHCSWTWAG